MNPPQTPARTVGVSAACKVAVRERSGRRGDRDICAAQAPVHGFDARIDVAVRLAVLGAGEGGVLGRLDPDHVGEHTGQVDGAFDGREPAEGELTGVVGDCEGPGQWEREDGEGGRAIVRIAGIVSSGV